MDPLCRKPPLHQLSYNHCPSVVIYNYSAFIKLAAAEGCRKVPQVIVESSELFSTIESKQWQTIQIGRNPV